MGGPVWIPKVFDKWRQKFFWFVAEDWIRERNTQTQDQAVPTGLMREGNFSQLLSPESLVQRRPSALLSPALARSWETRTASPIPGNIIPATSLSPNGIAILNAYPAPTPGFLEGTQ